MFVLIVSDFFGMFWTWTAETKQLGTWNKKVHNGFKVQTQAKKRERIFQKEGLLIEM